MKMLSTKIKHEEMRRKANEKMFTYARALFSPPIRFAVWKQNEAENEEGRRKTAENIH